MTHTFTAPLPLGPSVRDASLKSSDALPAAAGTTNGTVIDLGPLTDTSGHLELVEALLSAPALTTTQCPNTTTATYGLLASAYSNMYSPTYLANAVMVQTGNAAGGAAANSYHFKLPSNCPRYIQGSVTTANGGGTVGNCAASKMTLELLF